MAEGQGRLVTDIIQELQDNVAEVMRSSDLKMDDALTLNNVLDQLEYLQNHFVKIRDAFLLTIAECSPQEGGSSEHDSGSSSSPTGD